MKKFITLGVITILILTGCTTDKMQSDASPASETSEKLVYMQEIKSALDKSDKFETIEVQSVNILNGQEQNNTRLYSRNPNMYYFYPNNKEEISAGAYFENIYIEDENVIGSIRDALMYGGKEGELTFIETTIETIFLGEKFNSDIFYVELIESVDFIQSIMKEDNTYTIIANEYYFEHVRENLIANLKAQGESLPEEMQGVLEQNIAYTESQEDAKLTIKITLEDGKVVKIESIGSMMVSQFAENYTVTEEKFLMETNTEMTVTRFNENEAIREEIQAVYDMYKE